MSLYIAYSLRKDPPKVVEVSLSDTAKAERRVQRLVKQLFKRLKEKAVDEAFKECETCKTSTCVCKM
jgi:hypothetical protein